MHLYSVALIGESVIHSVQDGRCWQCSVTKPRLEKAWMTHLVVLSLSPHGTRDLALSPITQGKGLNLILFCSFTFTPWHQGPDLIPNNAREKSKSHSIWLGMLQSESGVAGPLKRTLNQLSGFWVKDSYRACLFLQNVSNTRVPGLYIPLLTANCQPHSQYFGLKTHPVIALCKLIIPPCLLSPPF